MDSTEAPAQVCHYVADLPGGTPAPGAPNRREAGGEVLRLFRIEGGIRMQHAALLPA